MILEIEAHPSDRLGAPFFLNHFESGLFFRDGPFIENNSLIKLFVPSIWIFILLNALHNFLLLRSWMYVVIKMDYDSRRMKNSFFESILLFELGLFPSVNLIGRIFQSISKISQFEFNTSAKRESSPHSLSKFVINCCKYVLRIKLFFEQTTLQ